MALKKSDLYSSLWRSCDELRGGMDASQYKDYILTLLFVKYVSDKAKARRENLIEVPPGGSFDDILALRGDKEIGDKINTIIGRLGKANQELGLLQVLDQADFNDEEKLGKGKEMQDRLSKLVTIFQDLDFRGSRAEGDDLLGDAYEYLMRHFATESGKSKGQFYTPAEVSRVIAKLLSITRNTSQDESVYDPTCGSGSLLLKVADEAPRGLTIYGQEKDNATWALAVMNMILHDNEIADIRKGDTITNPQFTSNGQLDTFDYVVANPPFSVKSWSNGLDNDYGRFELGRPPEKNGDYAFLLHILKSMKSTGTAAVILPHGVLFRGNAEADIRRNLIKRGYIKGIIGLPANLFYGTGIPACILVLDKHDAEARTGIFMIDASKGFMKDGNKNRLRPQDMRKIVDTFTGQVDIDGYSRMVPRAEIADPKNDYNLNLPRYIDSSKPDDVQDLSAHLHGGIPNRDLDALSSYWDAFPSLRSTLFTPNRPGYSDLAVEVTNVQQTVLDSNEFNSFAAQVKQLVENWFLGHRPILQAIKETTVPHELIEVMSVDLLKRFRDVPLLSEYDVYNQLMTYWHETMHDDLFLLMNEGWIVAAQPRKTIEDKERKLVESPDLIVGSGRKAEKYKTDLIPPALIVSRYFADEKVKVDGLAAAAEEAGQAIEDYIEEHAIEDGLLAGAMEDDRITKAQASTRLNEAKRENSTREEVEALNNLIRLYNAEANAKKALKDAQASLDTATIQKYGDLTESEVKILVLDDKWHGTITHRIASEVDALTLALVGRIQELGNRYGETISHLDAELEKIEAEVARHLAEMGVK